MSNKETGAKKIREILFGIWNKYRIQIILFLVVFGIKIILNLLLKSSTLSAGNDDIGTMAGAAYFAGLDWSNVISRALYYGWGYSMFMAPAFLLTDNVRLLFQAMLAYNALLLGLSVVICYNILNRIFKIQNKTFCVLVTLASNFYFIALMDTNIVFNETAIIFLTWLIFYILLKMQDNSCNGRSKIKNTIIMVLIMGYGLTVHTRFVLVWGAVFVMLIIYGLVKKKILVNPWVFLLGTGGLYALVRLLNGRIQDKLWLAAQNDEPLVNSMDSLGSQLTNLKELMNSEGLKGFLHMMLGQSAVMFFLSGGLLLLFLIITGIMIKRLFRKSFIDKESYFVTEHEEITDIRIGTGIIFIASLLIAALLFSNIGAAGVARTAIIKGWNCKWFVYSRYWGACCPMAIMLTFVYFYLNKDKKLNKVISIVSLIGMTIWGILFGIFVAVKLVGAKISSALVYQFLVGFTFNKLEDRFTLSGWMILLAVGSVWFLVMITLFIKKKYHSAAALAIIIFVYLFAYKMAAVDITVSKQSYYQYIDAKWILESYGISYNDHKKIYVDSKLSNYYNAQFELSRYELQISDYEEYSSPNQKETDIRLALTEQIGEEMCGNWYILYQKSQTDSEGKEVPDYYLLVRRGELSEKLIQQGVPLTDVRDVFGIEKLIYKNQEKDIRDIGIQKIKNTDKLEQDFNITSDMIDNGRFAIGFMFRNPSENPSRGKVNITITQGEIEKTYFVSMDNIVTRELVYVFADSKGFKEGKATITMTCPDMSRYKYVVPYTVDLSEETGKELIYPLRYNDKEYAGQLYMYVVIPKTLQGLQIIPANIAVTDKSEAKADVGSIGKGMKLSQKIQITDEMLAYKYLGMDIWVRNTGDSLSKGVITVTVTQGKQSDVFSVHQSELWARDYLRIVLDSEKYSAGPATITLSCKNNKDNKYIKPYVCPYDKQQLPDWIAGKIRKDGRDFDSYMCMNIYGILNDYTKNKYIK
ncbi:MAG: hypothetical protein HFI34_07205 [Lachnospiraceae bacterium]|nr:hypothetical protein [Lachnospiraceae bacterium]